MKFLIIYLLMLFVPLLPLQEEQGTKEGLQFVIKNAGINVKGYFENWSYTVQFDPKDLANSKIEGKAEVITIQTGIASRDKHLQTRQYFKSDTWPFITMVSKKITHKGGNRYEAAFDVTIRDITKPFTIPFTADKSGDVWKLSGSFTINRLDFGVGEKSMILGNEVKITISL
jgi:polyisoprenoid-binding protein YceI